MPDISLPHSGGRRSIVSLYSDRTGLIDTENAFKVGPYIRQVEEAGHRVIKCNLGEPDFPLPASHRDGDQAPDRRRPDALLRPAGHPAPARSDRPQLNDDARARRHSRSRGRLPGRQAPHRAVPADLLQPRRRGDLPEPGLSDLRVVHRLRGRDVRSRCISRRQEGSPCHRDGPRAADHDRDPADHHQLPVQSHRRRRDPRPSSSRSPR